MEARIQSLLAIFFLLFTALFFFSPYLNYQQFPYAGDYSGSDLTELNIPLRFIAASQARVGTIPQWSDLLSNGFPLAAEGQAGVFYPLNALHYWIFSFLPGIAIGLIVHYFLAALFTYLLCREYGVSRLGSCLSALAFGFGGPLLFRIKHINLLDAAVWLPLAVFWTERLVKRTRMGLTPVWLGVTLAIQFFAGHPQISYITLVTCGVYAIGRMMGRKGNTRLAWMKFFGAWLLAGAVAAGVGAVQLLPSYELSQISGRSRFRDISFATAFSYHPKQLLTFLNPFAFGNPAENTYRIPITDGGFWRAAPTLDCSRCWRSSSAW